MSAPVLHASVPDSAQLLDSGARNIFSFALNGYVTVRRVGSIVVYAFNPSPQWQIKQSTSTGTAALRTTIGDGFRPPYKRMDTVYTDAGAPNGLIIAYANTDTDRGYVDINLTDQSQYLCASTQWITRDAWPTTLPGTPA